MSRLVTIYKGWEIHQGAAEGRFKHGQLFKPMNDQGNCLEIDNLCDEDFAFGSVIIHDKRDKFNHKIFAKAFVWDLLKEYELVSNPPK